MGKNKHPLQQCLTILNDTMEYVKKYPTTVEAERGTPQRTTQHIMQHVLNQMNLKIELSDYQIVALLLRLPSIITSEKFICGNPEADQAYRQLVQVQQRANNTTASGQTTTAVEQFNQMLQRIEATRGPAWPPEEPFGPKTTQQFNAHDTNESEPTGSPARLPEETFDPKKLGTMRPFIFHEQGPSGEDVTRKNMAPYSALYTNRGEDLRELNRMEYRSLIGIMKRKEDLSMTKSQVAQYLFGTGFPCSSQFA